MAEYKLPVSMPALLGAGSEFIPKDDLPMYENGVLKLDEITKDTTMIGYIYGGISSSAPNIFFINTGTQSSASSQVFKVHLSKNKMTSTHEVNEQSQNGLGMLVFPNPSDDQLTIKFDLQSKAEVRLKVTDLQGKIMNTFNWGPLSSGSHQFNINEDFNNQNILIFQLQAGDKISTQKVIVK